jgi:hypothetical protein
MSAYDPKRTAANASKHCKVSRYPDATVGVIVTANNIIDGETRAPEIPMYVATKDQKDWYIYFRDGEKTLPAEQVFMRASNFGRSLHTQTDRARTSARPRLRP